MLRKRMENLYGLICSYDMDKAVDAMFDICFDFNCEEFMESFVHSSNMDSMVKTELDGRGWEGVCCFLDDIITNGAMRDEFYHVDRYGNLEVVTKKLMENYFTTLVNIVIDSIKAEENEDDEDDEESEC